MIRAANIALLASAAGLTDAAPRPTEVSIRTRPATRRAVWKSRLRIAPLSERQAAHASRT